MKKWIFLGALIVVIVIISCFVVVKNKTNEESLERLVLSEIEAIELLEQKYELAIDLYDVSGEYFNIENNYENIDGIQGYKINNYDTILKKNFTESMFRDFEEKATCLMIKNEIPYVSEGGRGFSTYVGVEEFKDITITENKITAIVKTKHNDMDGNFIGFKESEFIILRCESDWMIDKFNFDDINNSNLEF